MQEHYLWTEIYRPSNIKDVVLPQRMSDMFSAMVSDGQIQNMLLFGPPGTGKTTVARSMCAEIGASVLFIEASNDRNIDTLRTKITGFASTRSLGGKPKVVILDEADHLNAISTQPALRSFIELHAKNCRFILTANYPNKLIEPLRDSRLVSVDFTPRREEQQEVAGKLFRRLNKILKERDVEVDKKALAELIIQNLPDMRRILNRLQMSVRTTGKIDTSILSVFDGEDVTGLLDILKDPANYKQLRKWYAEHKDYDFETFLSALKTPILESVANAQAYFDAVEIFDDANKAYSLVADMEIHIMYMLLQLMQLDWKDE